MDAPGGTWSRRSVLGGVASALALGSGCLDRDPSTPTASEWPQRGYDAGATFYKPDGSPPTQDAEIAWETSVSNSLYTVIDKKWQTDYERRRYGDLTNAASGGSIWEYARTPLVVVGNHAYLSGGWGTVVDLSDGTIVETDVCPHRTPVGVAQTGTYTDGTLIGAAPRYPSDNRNDDVSLRGFQPPTDGRVWCDGPQRWAAGAPRDFEQTAAAGRIEDGTVVTVIPDFEPPYRIVAIDADDGRIEWENTVSHGIYRLRVEDGLAYASIADEEGGKITILDGSSVRQRVEIGPTDHLEAVRDGVAYFRDRRAEAAAPSITAVSAESGEPRQVLDGSAVSEQIAGTPTGVGDIVVGPDRLFAAVDTEIGHDPAVLAFDRSDGAIEWARQFPGTLRLTGADDALYVAGPREPGPHAYALDPASGDPLWVATLPVRVDSGIHRPIIADSKVLVPYGELLVALEEP